MRKASLTGKARKRVAYVGPFTFPDHDATSRRVLGIASSLSRLGYEVLIGAGQSDSHMSTKPYGGTNVLSVATLDEQSDKTHPPLIRLVRMFTRGRRTLHWLQSLFPRPDIVLLHLGYISYLQRILPWCRRHRIPIVVDVVEWFQPSHLPGGWWGPYHWNIEIAQRFHYVRAHNIIAITSYLETFYKDKGCHTLRIPPIFDVNATSARLKEDEGAITLVYAGFPGKKDLIGNVIEAVIRLDPQGKRVRLIIAGSSSADILQLEPFTKRTLAALPPCIEARGIMSHRQVFELVKSATYVPLLRPPLRYAQAGFPTKVPESLLLGTPVICNITSDLGDYIHHGSEGIICHGYSVDAFAEALQSAFTFSLQRRSEMRKAARVQAERSFDYRVYLEALAGFLDDLRQCS